MSGLLQSTLDDFTEANRKIDELEKLFDKIGFRNHHVVNRLTAIQVIGDFRSNLQDYLNSLTRRSVPIQIGDKVNVFSVYRNIEGILHKVTRKYIYLEWLGNVRKFARNHDNSKGYNAGVIIARNRCSRISSDDLVRINNCFTETGKLK